MSAPLEGMGIRHSEIGMARPTGPILRGHLSCQTKHPEGLEAFIAEYFGLAN